MNSCPNVGGLCSRSHAVKLLEKGEVPEATLELVLRLTGLKVAANECGVLAVSAIRNNVTRLSA